MLILPSGSQRARACAVSAMSQSARISASLYVATFLSALRMLSILSIGRAVLREYEEEPHLGGGAQDHKPPRFVPIGACRRVASLQGCGQNELAAVLQAFANCQRCIEELRIGNVHDDGRKDHPVVWACNRGREVGGQLALE